MRYLRVTSAIPGAALGTLNAGDQTYDLMPCVACAL